MGDTETFAVLVVITAAGRVAGRAVQSAQRTGARSGAGAVPGGRGHRDPAVPDLHEPPEQLVERVVTVALVCILFDGGMHLGWRRFRSVRRPDRRRSGSPGPS